MQYKIKTYINQKYLNNKALKRAKTTFQSFFIIHYLRSYHVLHHREKRSAKTTIRIAEQRALQSTERQSRPGKNIKKVDNRERSQKALAFRSYMIVFLELERFKKNSSYSEDKSYKVFANNKP
jgi:hypothetical protein